MAKISKKQSAYKKLKELSDISLLHSIKVYPKVRFDGQEHDEKIILFLRQHPYVLAEALFYSILILIMGFVIIFAVGTLPLTTHNKMTITLSLTILTFAGSISMFFFSFTKWFFNVFMVTSTRIIDLDYITIFDSRWSGAALQSIEDVSHSTPGFLSTLFDMGNLYIQTAAEREEFEIKRISKPRDVQDIIMDLVENAKKNDN